MLRRNILRQHLELLMVGGQYEDNFTRPSTSVREGGDLLADETINLHDDEYNLAQPEDSRPSNAYLNRFRNTNLTVPGRTEEITDSRQRGQDFIHPYDRRPTEPYPILFPSTVRRDPTQQSEGLPTDTAETGHSEDLGLFGQQLYDPNRDELFRGGDTLTENNEDSLSEYDPPGTIPEESSEPDTLSEEPSPMPRKSERHIWKEGDGNGRKNDTSPKLYNQPPHKLVEDDETTFPPKYVDLSSMWVYQIVRCHFISQKMRYARWPAVFPSRDPIRVVWTNKGLPAKLWSDVREKWVYPVIFGKYQLHGDEGAGVFDIDQSEFVESRGTNADHEIQEGRDCVVQQPPVSSGGLSSGGLAVASKDQAAPSSGDSTDEEPSPKRQKVQTGIKSKTPVQPKVRVTPKTAKSATATSTPAKEPKTEDDKDPNPSPSTRIISSATGGKRFAIDESDSEETPDNVKDLLAQVESLKLENAHYKEELGQAQGKVVLLAASLHSVWNVLGAYSERMTEWSSVFKKWEKGPVGANVDEFKTAISGLKDNKSFNNGLLMRVNKILNKLSYAFPALDRITLTDDEFNMWRNAKPSSFKKLIEEKDRKVNS